MLEYCGLVMSPSTLGSAVTQAASGRPPVGRYFDGDVPTAEDWLLGLWKTARDTPSEGDVRYALGMVLRTGDSRHLARLGPLVELGEVYEGQDILDALQRPHLYRKPETAKAFGRGLSTVILQGGMEYTPELRVLAEEDRMRGALLGALMVHDPEWAAGNLAHVTSNDAGEATAMVSQALDLVATLKGQTASAAFLEHLASDEHGVAVEVCTALGLEVPASADESVQDDDAPVRRLVWRGSDRRWFLIPEGLTFLEGSFELRRGLERMMVELAAVEQFAASEEEARRKMAGQLQEMVSQGLQALRKAIEDPSLEPASPEAITAQLTGVAERFAGSEQVQNLIGRLGAALDEAADKGGEATAAMKEALQRPSDADATAQRSPFQLRLGRADAGAVVELLPRDDVPLPGFWRRALGEAPADWLPVFHRALQGGFPGEPSELVGEVTSRGLRFHGSKPYHVGWIYASLAKMVANPDLLVNPAH